MKKLFATLTTLLLLASCGRAESPVSNGSIIPQPQEITYNEGSFEFGRNITIVINDQECRPTALLFVELLEKSSNRRVTIIEGEQRVGAINLILKSGSTSEVEGAYTLDVSSEQIDIKSSSAAGIFYGVQSLRQLMPASMESDKPLKANNFFSIPALRVVDAPRFAWRGYMKDVSRTFFGIDTIKKYLDVMALYKLNVFHFHLTDDQGWRIEMKKYPELTSEQSTQYPEQYNQPAERSGFFSQGQIREIVEYAAQRNITVVPEIDVPGHSWPTILSYPELGVNNNHTPDHVFPFIEAWGHWGNQFTPNTLDPTNEAVYSFLDDVFTEIVELFPSEYIHFGGDEVMHKFWTDEPHVVEFMRKNKMKDVHELQSYFVERVVEIITSKGRKPMGWNDILEDPKLTKESAIMCWLGENAIVKAATNGYHCVATPTHPLYLDITQADRNDGTMCDLNYRVINTLEAIYNYNPTQGLTPDLEHYVLGVQANMWPAVPQELKDVNVQNFPRLFALAEIAWCSGAKKDFEEFELRVEDAKKRLDVLGIDYYTPGGYIVEQWNSEQISAEHQILEWDVTEHVYDSGRVRVGFHTTEGSGSLEIAGVELLEDGKVIASEQRTALSPLQKNIFRPYNYDRLAVEKYKPSAKYSVRASLRGVGELDTRGNLTFSLYPY
ncbi:MAG: beta-N-acetylhexosaminidase [Rikenellaceae bacterium]